MSRSIEKGKQQILFNYLPGKVFDFGKKLTFAKIDSVRGNTFHQLNHSLIIRKIGDHARAWAQDYRPALSDAVLDDADRFVTIDPTQVTSELFPLVFWCSNSSCKKVWNYTASGQVPRSRTCTRCRTGRLSQLRFIKIHQCGHLEPLTPWSCPSCHSNDIALDERGSERISNFRWRCLACNESWPIRAGNCNRCSWPTGIADDQRMSVEVFRSNKTFYVQSVTMLNIPVRDYNAFFNATDWYIISTAKFLNLPALDGKRLNDYANQTRGGQLNANISEVAFGILLDQLNAGDITPEQYTREITAMRAQASPSVADLKRTITDQTGINLDLWEEAKYDLIDVLVPAELGNVEQLQGAALGKANELGISRITLVDDFPIVVTSYGFSRVESRPFGNDRDALCYLNPFPGDREHNGKFPVFVDKVQADAIMFQLNPKRIIEWLRLNGHTINLPQGTSLENSERAFFVGLFHQVNIHEKIFSDRPVVRMVLSLIHTLSHAAIKHAALLCGLDKTSISEYVIPKTLSIAFYCNHRFGATIGALTSLFQQSMNEWLDQIESERRCVYDPVCYDKGANCHSCTHLAETSCRLFNQNLGRIYLFGGYDHELQREIIGFMNP